MKRHDKNSGTVDLARVGVVRPRPKYATVDYVDSKFNELEIRLSLKINELGNALSNLAKSKAMDTKLLLKIARKVGI
ncbi:MAG: hypothetical protein LBP70_02100 [Mycoplasmataceae bacterium]|nr:hypothetical protein [Mycoplasmataceae bacterium]